ncbi:MAG TPA: M48 family metalloprotease [Allosphingosinicella sp.]|nr:M48 family metalloprotease [Allosphingosinicella sp.]
MAPQGYVTHAAHNRRLTFWLIAGYILAFELIAAFALTIFLLIFDPEHTILSDPLGYALRYAIPVAAVAGIQFWFLYRGHAPAVARMLDVRPVTPIEEPRLLRVAEEQCIALGIRQPRFGIIEVPEPNAVTVGEGPARGLIAVTRGLIDLLDDDELAAVLAHEASHIRNGDTKVLAANHALMRTAVILQTHNPLRLEDWRQMILILFLPAILLIFLASGAVTMASMRLARAARRGLRLSRDHIADGEAVRVTHFPEALVSALRKIGGRSTFPGSDRFEGLLFDGRADREGGSHPAVEDRIAAITTLGAGLMQPGRARRDTRANRPAAALGFGRRVVAAAGPAPMRELEKPEEPSLAMLGLFFSDRERFWKWQNASIDWCEWREGERRNAFGIGPNMAIPLAATLTFLLVFHWPNDGDFTRMRSLFNPVALVDVAREMNSGPFCSGPSYPDGKCPGGT